MTLEECRQPQNRRNGTTVPDGVHHCHRPELSAAVTAAGGCCFVEQVLDCDFF